jgi:hypothetical protein
MLTCVELLSMLGVIVDVDNLHPNNFVKTIVEVETFVNVNYG